MKGSAVGLAVLLVFVFAAVTVGLAGRAVIGEPRCVDGRVPAECAAVLRKLAGDRLTDVRCALSSPAERVTYRSDSLSIVADLYRPEHPDGSPGLVLLHGASTYGRRLPLVTVLARQFQAKGYTVLAPDLRGFGEAEDPRDMHSPAAFDFARDVNAALDFLTSQTRVEASRLYVVGHSFGAGVALAAQARDRRIRKAVLFGPGRRMTERSLAPGAPEREYFLDRAKEDMQLAERPVFDVWRRVREPLNIENYVAPETRRAPLFLIDAEQESPDDLRFLRAIHRRMASRVEYWTVPGTDHYLSTGLLAHRPCYNRPVVSAFVRRVDGWLRQ